MLRWIAVLSTLVLSGCVTTREVVYRDRYYPEQGSRTAYYDESGSDRYYSRDGSYYSPSYQGSGDYYYGSDYYAPASYLDYPAYYSLFWSLNRSWYDPYYYPNYYYGVTYFPRNYLSVSFGGGYAWPNYSYWSYSPYRYSWADNYYDWSPWHGGYYGRGHNNHNRPRYGSARNEAERLSRISDSNRAYSRGDYGYGTRSRGASNDVRRTAYGDYGTTRGNTRDADYGSRGSLRQDPGTRGFGVPYNDGVRRNGAARGAEYGQGSNRQLPATRGFGVPVDGSNGSGGDVRRRDADYGATRQINRVGGGDASGYGRAGSTARGYDEGMALPRQSYQRGSNVRSRPSYDAAPVAREYSRPEPAARNYDRGGDGGYSAPPRERYSAPTQNYEAAPPANYSAPSRGYDGGGRSAPAPSYSAPEPRFESRSEPARESRSESRSDSGGRGDVRRVGSRRDDD